jgi:hypothetical protein
MERPPARLEPVGKFLYRGGVKTPVRGVTYRPFTPTDASADGFEPRVADRDLSAMAAGHASLQRLVVRGVLEIEIHVGGEATARALRLTLRPLRGSSITRDPSRGQPPSIFAGAGRD